jgi:endoglucanase
MRIKFYRLSFEILIGSLILTCSQNNKPDTATGEFTMRTGVNVSHWLSQSDKRGEERKNYIDQSDFNAIASMGFDHVRIPVDEEQLWDAQGNKYKEAFELLHNAIGWAIAAKLRVIVDLHILRSHHFIAESNPLWTDPAEQEKLIDLWRQLSGELRGYPNEMLAYEILNEAVANDPDDWNRLFNKAIAEIRKEEPNRKIVIGSNRWQVPDTFPDMKVPENDSNIILSFHFYTPMALTHHLASWSPVAEYAGPVHYPGQIVDTLQYEKLSESTIEVMRRYANGYFTKDTLEQVMSPAIQFAKEKNLPLYCGEFGVYPTIPEEIKLLWYRDVCEIFNRNRIAYCHWCYKGDFPVVNEKGEPDRKLVSVLTEK